jgi:hypothetical protein
MAARRRAAGVRGVEGKEFFAVADRELRGREGDAVVQAAVLDGASVGVLEAAGSTWSDAGRTGSGAGELRPQPRATTALRRNRACIQPAEASDQAPKRGFSPVRERTTPSTQRNSGARCGRSCASRCHTIPWCTPDGVRAAS